MIPSGQRFIVSHAWNKYYSSPNHYVLHVYLAMRLHTMMRGLNTVLCVQSLAVWSGGTSPLLQLNCGACHLPGVLIY